MDDKGKEEPRAATQGDVADGDFPWLLPALY